MNSNSKRAIFLVGHGTKSKTGVTQFFDIVELLRKRVNIPVGAGFIELSKPDIKTGMAELLETTTAQEVTVLPLLLLAAGHAKTDIPAAIEEARSNHPGVRFVYGRDLSVTPTVLDLIEQRALDPFDSQGISNPRSTHFTLLVGRGSTDPDANSDLYKISRLLTERGRLNEVSPAFVSLAEPSVPHALDRLKRAGAGRITVVPYFLFAGTLLDRIYSQSQQWQIENSDVSINLSKEIGSDPALIDLLIEREREGMSGKSLMNCDMCIYRVRIPGHEHEVGLPVAIGGITHNH